MIEYLGQIRNAAEHGADNNEGNKVWEISYVTSVSYPMIVAELIKNILLYIDGKLSV